VRETEILVEQQPPQGVFVCDHAGLVINKVCDHAGLVINKVCDHAGLVINLSLSGVADHAGHPLQEAESLAAVPARIRKSL